MVSEITTQKTGKRNPDEKQETQMPIPSHVNVQTAKTLAQEVKARSATVIQNPETQKENLDRNAEVTVPDRKAPVTHKDLMIQFLIGGSESLRVLLDEMNDPVTPLERMIGNLEAKNLDAADLMILRDHYAELNQAGSPGRKSPEVGDSREYTVQQPGEDGDLFARIPLGTLMVSRGEKVLVEFHENGILIRKSVAPST